MILLLATLAGAIPPEPFRPEYEAYSRCIDTHFRSKSHEITSDWLLRKMALPHCRAERARFVETLAAASQGDANQRLESAEAGVSVLEQYLPGTIEDTVVIVSRDECPSGLKVKSWCLR